MGILSPIDVNMGGEDQYEESERAHTSLTLMLDLAFTLVRCNDGLSTGYKAGYHYPPLLPSFTTSGYSCAYSWAVYK